MTRRHAVVAAVALLAAACSPNPDRVTIDIGPGIEMIRIDAGTFTMGTPGTVLPFRSTATTSTLVPVEVSAK